MHIKLQGLKFETLLSKYRNDYELMKIKPTWFVKKLKLKILAQSNGSKYITNNMNCYICVYILEFLGLVESFEAVLKTICINILTHHYHRSNFHHCHPAAGLAHQIRQNHHG